MFETSLLVVMEKLYHYNMMHPEYHGYAHLRFYDDGSGGVKYFDYELGLLKSVCELDDLINNY